MKKLLFLLFIISELFISCVEQEKYPSALDGLRIEDQTFSSAALKTVINVNTTLTDVMVTVIDTKTTYPNTEPFEVFQKAMSNVAPQIEVRPRRVGGATYQVPVEVKPERGVQLSIRWIVAFARGKKGMPMWQRLMHELMDAYNNTGSSIKRREDTHRMAEANRAFAHYRW